jgi:DNA (cytosine-5)-methyltransferase 1
MGKQTDPSYKSIEDPLLTITTQDSPHLIEPVIEPFVMGKQGHSPAYRPVTKPTPTITADGRPVLIEPVAKPFILNRNGDNGGSRSHDTEEPIPTATTRGAGYLVEPVMVKYYGGDDCSSVDVRYPR